MAKGRKAAAEPRVVAAVGTIVLHGGTKAEATRAARVQDAMVKAINDALAEGVDIHDSEELLKRQIAARDAVAE